MAIGFGIASRNWWRAQIKGGLFPSFSLNFDTIGTDFTFTRNSFATRVNENGLIETVTDLGSELIQNGNFEELGSELITSGNETADIVSIADNQNVLIQTSIVTIGKTYQIDFEIYDYVEGSIFLLRPNDLGVGSAVSANGTYTYTVVADASTSLIFRTDGVSTTLKLRGISVKQVDPNDEWSLGSDWVIQDNKLTYGGNTSTDYTRQLGALTNNSVGKEYIINFEVLDSAFTIGFTSSSSFFDDENGNIIKSEFNVGAHTIKAFSTNSATDFRIYGYTDSGNGGSIDNVSVQEVLEDDVPRIDYSTGEAAFLLEPISTNFIDYSEDIEGSNWTTSGIATTTDVTTSPDGTQNADLIDSVSNGSCFISDSTLTFTIGNTYTFSVFAKKGNNDWIRTAHVSSATNASWFDLENGVVGTVNGVSGTIEDFGNGWYKCTNTFVATQATGGNQVFIGICDANGSTDAGASGQNDYVWGMQVEELSYATSYIPTSGTTVTRAQETCLDGVVSANSLEGVLYWEGSSYFDSTTIIAELSQGDITNRVSLFYQNGNDSRSSIRVNNVQNTLQGGGSLSSTKKLAIVWSNNIASFWVNGSQVDTDTYVGSIPEGVLTALNFAQVGGAAPFYGRTKDLRVYDKALTDDELINLTTI